MDNAHFLKNVSEEELYEILKNDDTADFSNCYFYKVKISISEGRISSFEGSRFYECKFMGFDGQHVNFQKAVLTGCFIENANFNHVNMTGIEIYGTHIKDASFRFTDLTDARMRYVLFETSVLYQTEFQHALMDNIHFQNVEAENITTDFSTVTMTMTGARNKDIQNYRNQILWALHVNQDEIDRAIKKVRFIRSNYETIFEVNDGDMVLIDGQLRKVNYMDEYHFNFDGGKCYHIWEFAEKVNPQGNRVLPAQQSILDQIKSKGVSSKKDGHEKTTPNKEL
ncbi:pentapeptide repeat-containing protein [Clostridium formicaceticum]|uniref:Pentapeptide repeats (8 copies) n=1 Tax=Clostridium formicaceticum TaxID=1497 RepID=A0AAC9RS21_9CLOT|nr:pentapeptide repeat-containing protein [Clostridium formicaceticum]AOY74734.1 hypothetical protein BJL90_01450 [Clostridium formicaceticum]ARE89120.1 Pentapeptide repeats (8 copies) [Clostridium formicaceticum]